MREQIELLKNLRDTNWIQFRAWDSIELAKSSVEIEKRLQSNNFYTITNDFGAGKFIHIEHLPGITLSKEAILQEFNKTNSSIRLCIDSLGRYTHSCIDGSTITNFASFLQVEPLTTKNTLSNTPIDVDKAYKITVFFASFNK